MNVNSEKYLANTSLSGKKFKIVWKRLVQKTAKANRSETPQEDIFCSTTPGLFSYTPKSLSQQLPKPLSCN